MDKETVVVVPVYEPDFMLADTIESIRSLMNCSFVVVNDGSVGSNDIFRKIKIMPDVTLLNHDKNCGKGNII